MTIAYVKDTGKVAVGVSSSVSASFASLPAVGNLCIGTLAARTPSGVVTFSDNQSNSWATDKFEELSNALDAAAAAGSAQIGTSAGTFTVTATPGGSTLLTLMGVEYSGLATSSAFDASAGATGSPVANLAIGPTGTLAQADELVVTVFAQTVNPPSLSIPSGYTSLWTETGGPFTSQDGGAAYLIVSSTSPITSTWTNSDSFCAGVVATYKAAAGGPPTGLRGQACL